MKDTHLTIRLPAQLGEDLDARAERERVARSHVVREAVVRYLTGDAAPQDVPPRRSARELAARWRDMPHLRPDEARAFAEDIAAARAGLIEPSSPWE
jgi:Arc/MetJ-type ribon-helix-helix transcriptional regulator